MQKKILFYINSLNRGGAERVFSVLANEFNKTGYKTVFVTSFKASLEYTLDANVKRYSIEENEIKDGFLKKNIRRTKTLRKIIKSEKPDFVVSTSPEANFRLLFSTIGIKCKKVITIISDCKHEYAGKVYAFLAKTLYRRANGIICQTNEEKIWFPKSIQKKCTIIYNPIDERFFEFEQPKVRNGIVAVGRLVPLKRHIDIINAFNKIHDKVHDDLIIYGDGPCKQELLQRINELGLENRVCLAGKVDDVAVKIYDAKLFVHASEYEGLSNAIMEAMTLGLPCLLTDCDGGCARELLEDQKNGFLVKVGDVNDLAKKMSLILNNDDLINELSYKSKKKAEEFRGGRVFEQWKCYIEKL
jgi:glycosyltransferase involved in cell wall biosynthesis